MVPAETTDLTTGSKKIGTETAFTELPATVAASEVRMVEQLAHDETTLLEAYKDPVDPVG